MGSRDEILVGCMGRIGSFRVMVVDSESAATSSCGTLGDPFSSEDASAHRWQPVERETQRSGSAAAAECGPLRPRDDVEARPYRARGREGSRD